MVLVLVEDLMFRSRVEAHLSQRGVPHEAAAQQRLREALQRVTPTHVVVNLAEASPDDLAVLADLPVRVLGFGPHVDRERFLGARRLGAKVVANSALESRLAAFVAEEAT
jgi:hypothetical protein